MVPFGGMVERDMPAGFVLTGGRGTRMGRPKALLTVDGETLAKRTADVVASVCRPVTLVGDPAAVAALGYPALADAVPGCGPLAALVTALNRTYAEWNVVVACDMPALTIEFVAGLVKRAHASPADCVVPIAGGSRVHPLCAAYRRRCRAAFTEALAEGTRKMRDVLERLDTEYWAVADTGPLLNINTPPEWEDFLRHIEKTRGRLV